LSAELSHDWADSDEEGIVADRFDVLTCDFNFLSFTRLGKIVLDSSFDLAVINGPDKVFASPHPNRLLLAAIIAWVTDHHDWQSRVQPAHPANNVQSVPIPIRKDVYKRQHHNRALKAPRNAAWLEKNKWDRA